MARFLIFSLALLVLIPLASAQERKYRFEFFGGAGYPLEKEFVISYPQSTIPIQGSHQFSTGGQGGVRFGLDGHRYWGQDYSYSYSQNLGEIRTPYGGFSFTNRFHQASTTILFYPWTYNNAISPYLDAGLGAMWASVKQSAVAEATDPLRAGLGTLKSETLFAFHAGGGVRFRLSNRFGIRLDVRDTMSRALRYGLPKTSSDPNQPVLPVSGVFHQLSGTIGIVVHF